MNQKDPQKQTGQRPQNTPNQGDGQDGRSKPGREKRQAPGEDVGRPSPSGVPNEGRTREQEQNSGQPKNDDSAERSYRTSENNKPTTP